MYFIIFFFVATPKMDFRDTPPKHKIDLSLRFEKESINRPTLEHTTTTTHKKTYTHTHKKTYTHKKTK